MIKILLSDEIKEKCPELCVMAIQCDILNSHSNDDLWGEIRNEENEIRKRLGDVSSINKWNPIRATREAYKKCGKDPNRYRPSAESLIRRIVRDLPLYEVNTVVDLINLISVHTGYSIGGFDNSKIEGEELVLGIGREGEIYNGIGRGILNIEGLPVYRDAIGGIGTPTSDEERTKLEVTTKSLLMIINGYSGKKELLLQVDYIVGMLNKYASASSLQHQFI